MKIQSWISFRVFVLALLWVMPIAIYVAIGIVALYQKGWLSVIAMSLPVVWLLAWLVGKLWKPVRLYEATEGSQIETPDFWTPRDVAAMAIVEQYRIEASDIDRTSFADLTRYQRDAEGIAVRLAEHYHGKTKENAIEPLTLVEIFAVVHLAVEDLEEWILQNIPGSDRATIGQLSQLPRVMQALDGLQKIVYFASSLFNPGKLLAYPLWRKSGQVSIELQNELIRSLYQRYLGLIGYYLIEMYSGRLRGGSKRYREQFGTMADHLHASGGQISQLSAVTDHPTTIAVMGQVKAGKSSLINALIGDDRAPTGILPLTRYVQRYEYPIPGSTNVVALLDTPGYAEADVTKKQLNEIAAASEAADLLLLVMAANVSARQADIAMVQQLDQYYREHNHLKPPVIIAVLTHIDLLRPVREWSPPYDWRNPHGLKEESIAGAVDYVKELFGDRINGFACVYAGNAHAPDSSVVEELVPQIVQHLDQGKMAAILKAFYKQLSAQRFQKLLQQVQGLIKTVAHHSGF